MDRLYGVAEGLILVVVDEKREGSRAKGRRRWPGPPTACWEKELKPGAELEGGAEGHNTLFSPLSPSETCHTHVMDGERRTVKKRKGEEVRKKNSQSHFCVFFL